MLLLAATLARADVVTIDLTLPQELIDAGLDEAALEQQMAAEINGVMRLTDMGKYMSQMADANVLSAKGMGADYASNMQTFAVGGGFGTAVQDAGFKFASGQSELPEAGFALQISGMAGVNFGALAKKDNALRRFKLYVSGMSATTNREPFAATFFNYGAHLQIKVIGGVGDQESGVAEWGGIDLTSGYEYSQYSLRLEQAFPIDAGDMAWAATGTYDISAVSRSVPIEVSTNLRILVATVFAGGAVDVNLYGRSDNLISLDGPLTYTLDGTEYDIGTAGVAMDAYGLASSYTPRIFAGAQVNIFVVKVYGQLNVTPEGGVGGHLGARVVL